MDTLGTQVDRISRFFDLAGKFIAVAVILCISALLVKVGLDRLNIGADSRHYILLSGRNRSLDVSYESYSAVNPKISYMRAESAFGTALLKKLPFSIQKQNLVMVPADDLSKAVAGTAGVEEKLRLAQNVPLDYSRMPFVIAGFAGFFVGLGLKKPSGGFLALLFGSLALLSLFKFSHSCPTCPRLTVLGVDASIAGLSLYGLMALLTAINPAWIKAVFYPIVGIVSLWQLSAILGATNLCLACTLIFFGNTLLLGLSFDTIRKLLLVAPSRRGFAVALVIFVFLGGLSITDGRIAEAQANSMRPKPTAQHFVSLIGMNLEQLGVDRRSLPKGACLVIFGRAGCEACEQARLALLSQSKVQVTAFELVEKGQAGTWGVTSVPNDIDLFPHTPTFAVLGSDQRIKATYDGWSQDPVWIAAFLQGVSIDLSSAAKGGVAMK